MEFALEMELAAAMLDISEQLADHSIAWEDVTEETALDQILANASETGPDLDAKLKLPLPIPTFQSLLELMSPLCLLLLKKLPLHHSLLLLLRLNR